jgi:hypothetical protein
MNKRSGATEKVIGTTPRDPGALSGLLAGVSFIGGVGGATALADSPYPRPGSEPAEIRRYFTENSRSARISATGQLISTVSLARIASASDGGGRRRRACHRGVGDLGAMHPGAQRQPWA